MTSAAARLRVMLSNVEASTPISSEVCDGVRCPRSPSATASMSSRRSLIGRVMTLAQSQATAAHATTPHTTKKMIHQRSWSSWSSSPRSEKTTVAVPTCCPLRLTIGWLKARAGSAAPPFENRPDSITVAPIVSRQVGFNRASGRARGAGDEPRRLRHDEHVERAPLVSQPVQPALVVDPLLFVELLELLADHRFLGGPARVGSDREVAARDVELGLDPSQAVAEVRDRVVVALPRIDRGRRGERRGEKSAAVELGVERVRHVGVHHEAEDEDHQRRQGDDRDHELRREADPHLADDSQLGHFPLEHRLALRERAAARGCCVPRSSLSSPSEQEVIQQQSQAERDGPRGGVVQHDAPIPGALELTDRVRLDYIQHTERCEREDERPGCNSIWPPGGDPHAAGFVEHEPPGVFVADARAEEDARAPDGAREREHGENRESPSENAVRDRMTSNGRTSNAAAREAAVPGAFGKRPVPKKVASVRAVVVAVTSAFGFPDQQDPLPHVEDAGEDGCRDREPEQRHVDLAKAADRVLERELEQEEADAHALRRAS